MKKNILSILTLLMLMIAPLLLQSQSLPDPGGGYTGGDPDATPVPFDGGLTLLVGAGIAYGMGMARTIKVNKQEQEK